MSHSESQQLHDFALQVKDMLDKPKSKVSMWGLILLVYVMGCTIWQTSVFVRKVVEWLT